MDVFYHRSVHENWVVNSHDPLVTFHCLSQYFTQSKQSSMTNTVIMFQHLRSLLITPNWTSNAFTPIPMHWYPRY